MVMVFFIMEQNMLNENLKKATYMDMGKQVLILVAIWDIGKKIDFMEREFLSLRMKYMMVSFLI